MMTDSRNDSISSPRDALRVNTSATMDSSNLSTGICSSPLSNDGSPRKTPMSEKEINSLVHNALIRARQSTKSFSPTTKSPRTPASGRSKRPIVPTSASSRGRPPVYSSSPLTSPSKKTISVPSLNVSSRDLGEQLSTKSSAADQSTIEPTNSSDDIIRRVEEEIANARKAAQEATRRLAGASANFMADVHNRDPRSATSRQVKIDAYLGEMMEKQVNGTSSSSSDEDGNFDSVLDLIGEDFNETTEEKKEADNFVRTRSIRQCTLDYSPVKTIISINQSIDDVPMDELEAVLSDEREQDILKANMEENKRVYASVAQEVTSVVEDPLGAVSDDLADPTFSQDETEEVGKDSLESDNTSDDQATSIGQVDSEKPTGANSEDDENSVDEKSTEFSPQVADKSIENLEESMGTKEEAEITNDSDGIADELVEDDAVDPEKIEENSTNSGEDDADETTISDKNSNFTATMTEDRAISDDQTTEVTDNKDRLTNALLSNLSARRDEKVPSSPTPSGTVSFGGSAGRVLSPGKKVKFKQRYPIPQKMKKFRSPSEIRFDHQIEKPNEKLWISMPKKDLKELLEAVTGSSMQRRSNACGTLKVLSTQTKNQLTLVRTQGFMDAIVFAISDNFSIEDTDAGTAARTRAVNVILNISAKKDNRYHVLMHPGLRESLVKCLIEDKADARELTCAVLATLGKSPHCREPIGKTKKLVDTLATILKSDVSPTIEADGQAYIDEEKIDYSGDDELSREISNSYSSSRSGSTNSSYANDSVETQKEDPEMRRRTRMNACAALLHLSKECSISEELCSSDTLVSSLISCCNELQNPIHTKCLEILANLTRFPQNNARLVEHPDLVDTLILNGSQDDDVDRLWSMRIFQNLSSESSAKAKLASTSVLQLLSSNMMRKQHDEQLAATSTMYNISTEPGAVVPLTNTKNVVATLVHVAHSPTSMPEVRTIACDALATLGLWLQTLSSSGTVPEGVKSVPLPTYITSGWERWEE